MASCPHAPVPAANADAESKQAGVGFKSDNNNNDDDEKKRDANPGTTPGKKGGGGGIGVYPRPISDGGGGVGVYPRPLSSGEGMTTPSKPPGLGLRVETTNPDILPPIAPSMNKYPARDIGAGDDDGGGGGGGSDGGKKRRRNNSF